MASSFEKSVKGATKIKVRAINLLPDRRRPLLPSPSTNVIERRRTRRRN